jgi:hypothetical protein
MIQLWMLLTTAVAQWRGPEWRATQWRAAEPHLLEVDGRNYAMCYSVDRPNQVFIGDAACVDLDNSTFFGSCMMLCTHQEVVCEQGTIVFTNNVAEVGNEILDEIDTLFSKDTAIQAKQLVEKMQHEQTDGMAENVCHAVAMYTKVNTTVAATTAGLRSESVPERVSGAPRNDAAEVLSQLQTNLELADLQKKRTKNCHLCDIHSCHDMESLIGGRPIYGALSACLFCEGAAAPGACNFDDLEASVREWPVCDEICKFSDCSVIKKVVSAFLEDKMHVTDSDLPKYTQRFMYPMCYACGEENRCSTTHMTSQPAGNTTVVSLDLAEPPNEVFSNVVFQELKSHLEKEVRAGDGPAKGTQEWIRKKLLLEWLSIGVVIAVLVLASIIVRKRQVGGMVDIERKTSVDLVLVPPQHTLGEATRGITRSSKTLISYL